MIDSVVSSNPQGQPKISTFHHHAPRHKHHNDCCGSLIRSGLILLDVYFRNHYTIRWIMLHRTPSQYY